MDWGQDNQYSTTSYGGQGGAGGGGFVPGDQTSPSGARKVDRDETLRPVTIKQLVEAQASVDGSEFTIDGQTISSVIFIGQIRNSAAQTFKIVYKIDDGTGMMEATRWLDEQEKAALENGELQALPQDIYVRVFGKVKEVNSKRYVAALFVRPIEDHNEISTHFLEATLVHLQNTRGIPGQDAKAGAVPQGDQMDIDGGGMANNNRNLSKLSVPAKKILKYLQTANQPHEGLHFQLIAQGLNMEINQVQKGGHELIDEGMIYTTVDEETWALLDI